MSVPRKGVNLRIQTTSIAMLMKPVRKSTKMIAAAEMDSARGEFAAICRETSELGECATRRLKAKAEAAITKFKMATPCSEARKPKSSTRMKAGSNAPTTAPKTLARYKKLNDLLSWRIAPMARGKVAPIQTHHGKRMRVSSHPAKK